MGLVGRSTAVKIKQESRMELLIVQPNSGFRAAAILVLVIGAIATIGIALSGEGMVNAAVPILMVIAGSLGLRYGGKPDTVKIDKTIGLLEVKEYPGAFSKPKVEHFPLSEIDGLVLEQTMIDTQSPGTASKGLALAVRFKDGKTQTITPFTNQRKRVRAVHEAASRFLS
jgi:hypothetical protein